MEPMKEFLHGMAMGCIFLIVVIIWSLLYMNVGKLTATNTSTNTSTNKTVSSSSSDVGYRRVMNEISSINKQIIAELR